jgi:type IV fimbrial biogenesis protein FimT
MDASTAVPPQGGFTLVELLVTLCVVGVVTGIAVPYARSFGASMTLGAFSNGYLSHLHLARSEAIKRNGAVALCKSRDGASCADAGGWDQGWIVFQDANGDGVREPGEQLIQRADALPDGFHLRGNLNVTRYVLFTPSGATRTAAGAFQAGTLTVCRHSMQQTEARQIILNAVGRPRLQKLLLENCS